MSGRFAKSLVLAAVGTLVLAGCAAHVEAGTPRHRQTPAGIASPTPSPVPTSQAVRVPTTCDELMPSSVLTEIDPGLRPEPSGNTEYASSWADTRVGALECRWSNAADGDDRLQVWVTVGPDVTRQGFEGFLNGEQGGGTPAPAVGPDVYTLEMQGRPGGFLFLTPHYGVSGFVFAGAGVTPPPDAATLALQQVYGVVSGLPAPSALWVPNPNLTGAADCASLATESQLDALGGLPQAREMKSDGGEYSTSLFDLDRQVGGYWCTWGSEDQTVTGTISVSVLPGGAEYAAKARPAGSTDVAGLGESAYLTPRGALNVVAGHGWVQVYGSGDRPTADQAKALAKQVLVNVGYTG